jgi:hypothetical protein
MLGNQKRLSAKELLKHRFIKSAKKTSYLTELVERHEQWMSSSANADAASIRDTQRYETIKLVRG